MPRATIVVPAYNVAATIAETLTSLIGQTFTDHEILVVDDGSNDDTLDVVARFDDRRLRVIRQCNRGLAGAHNTGIAHARGEYIGFCDADDLWEPEKLARHVAHLYARPSVGISFSGSRMIDGEGRDLGLCQSPKLTGITARDVLLRNPIGNGSAAVMRRAALDAMAWRPPQERDRDWWFDETFRQSDDIEGWLRFALTTSWEIEGIPGNLTRYRINPGGLSANVMRQHQTWERMLAKMAGIAPKFVRRHGAAARAYQYRYLCRRAVSMRNGELAFSLALRSLRTSLRPLLAEPVKTLTTLGAATVLRLGGAPLYARIERAALSTLSPAVREEGTTS